MSVAVDRHNPHDWQCSYNGITEVDHDWGLASETIGDYGVVNGTATYVWLECANCGLQKEADSCDFDDSFEFEP